MLKLRTLTEADAGVILRLQGMEDLYALLEKGCSSCRKGRKPAGLFPSICLRLERTPDMVIKVKKALGVDPKGIIEFRSPLGYLTRK